MCFFTWRSEKLFPGVSFSQAPFEPELLVLAWPGEVNASCSRFQLVSLSHDRFSTRGWILDQTSIFAQVDAFVQRCKDLIEVGRLSGRLRAHSRCSRILARGLGELGELGLGVRLHTKLASLVLIIWLCTWPPSCAQRLLSVITASFQFSSVHLLSCVHLFATPWTVACQASLSITNSWSLLKLTSIESVMPSNHLILCRPLLLLPLIFSSVRVFANESVLHIRWTKYWNFSFSISPSNEYSGLISFRMDWLDFLAVQGTLKSLLQHHSSKASVLQCSAFFMVQLSHPYMTTGKHSFD